MTVEDINGDITLNRSGCINTTAIESIHVSIVDLPMHITLVCAARFTYLLLTCSGSLFKITATDVTLGVVIRYCCILVVSTGKVELIICSTGHGNRFMRRRLTSVAMSTQTKRLDVDIATHMDIVSITRDRLTLCRNELFKVSTLQN